MSIWVTGAFLGFHRYDKAPDDVSYLRDKHRHKFTWRAEIFVTPGNDRELEFHQVQTAIRTWVMDVYLSKGAYQTLGSCETIALDISAFITENISGSGHIVTVSEDEECGSTYYREL